MTTKTWNGSNADWSTAADWSPTGEPGSGDSAVISLGSVSITGNDGTVSAVTLGATLGISSGYQQGGGALTVTGAFTNTGYLTIGDNGSATGSASLTVGSFVNFVNTAYGSINILGTTGVQDTLNVGSAAGLGATGAVEGSVYMVGPSLLEFASSQINTIAANSTLNLIGASAFVADAGSLTSNSALVGLTSVIGNFDVGSGGKVTTTGNLSITGAVNLDSGYQQGGSTLAIGGSVTNSGTLNIGAGGSLEAAANVTIAGASGLTNYIGTTLGNINLSGTTPSQEIQYLAKLYIAGAAGFGGAGIVYGNVNISYDAMIEFASGSITTIAASSELGLTGANAFLADAGSLTSNSALTGLKTVTGSLYVGNGDVVTTAQAMTITGLVAVDNGYQQGGSTLTVGGAITNSGRLFVGAGGSMSAPGTVTTTGLTNFIGTTLGTISVSGNTSVLAKLNVTGAAGFGATGKVYGAVSVTNDGLIEFASGEITSILASSSLALSGANAYVADASNLTSNSALTGLTSVVGTLSLANSSVVATSAGLANSGTVEVDYGYQTGGSTLTIGGIVTNTGNVYVGNGGSMYANATLNSTGINNTGGNISLSGNGGAAVPQIATWDVTSGVAGFGVTGQVVGTVNLAGPAVIEFVSGQITTIAAGAVLGLNGAASYLADASNTGANSALTGLTKVIGTFGLGNGAEVTTTAGVANSGAINVDAGYQQGGSTLTIGGALTNTGTVNIGNGGSMPLAATLDAASISNTGGNLNLSGNAGATVPQAATLALTGAAGFGVANTLEGSVELAGDALVQFGSGQITTIASGATLGLNGATTFIADASDTSSNSALTGLTKVIGVFGLGNGAVVTTSAGLTNTGTINVDAGYQQGGSTLTVGGVFNNTGTLTVGGSPSGALDAKTMTNSGTVNLYAGGVIALSGGSYAQTAGQTTVSGTLTSGVALSGGAFTIASSGSVSGAIAMTGSSTLLLASVQAAANVLTLSGYGDQIVLESIGYSQGEFLALQSTSGGVETFAIENAGGTVLGTLALKGSYQAANFAVVNYNGDAEVLAGPSISITGATAGQQIADKQTDTAFAGVTISDVYPSATDTVTVTLSNPANGSLASSAGGTYNASSGVYTVSGGAASVTAAVRALVFTPTVAAGASATTTFTIAVNNNVFPTVSNATTTVTASSYSGGGLSLGFGGAPGYGLSIYNTNNNWDTVSGSHGSLYVTSAKASVDGGGDSLYLLGAGVNAVSLYQTAGTWDNVVGSSGTVYLSNAQSSVTGGGDTINLLGTTGNQSSLYNTANSWDYVTGSSATIYLTNAQTSINGGGDTINGLGTARNYASLYGTSNTWDTFTGSDDTVYLTSAQASVIGGGDSINLSSTQDAVSLYQTGGAWDGISGSNATIYLSDAQSSISGGDDTINLLGNTGNQVSLYSTNNSWDFVTGSNATAYLSGAQTSVSGSLDTIYFSGGTGNAASLYNTNGSWDTVNGSGGTVYLNSSQSSVVGGGDTISMSGSGDIASLASTAGVADSVSGSSATVNLYSAQASVTGSNDAVDFFGASTATLSGGSDSLVFAQGIGGLDAISGFATSDVIHLSKTDFASFSALQSHLTQSGANAVITLNASDTITLNNFTAANLTAAQFVFS